MKKKILMALVFMSLLSSVVYAASVYEKTCPYDDDFKHALRKALIDYLKDPSKSKLRLNEVKDMLSFYLSKPDIMDADCSQKSMNSLVEKADKQIPDSILKILRARKLEKCTVCSDGTVCGEKNVKDQTCMCIDIDQDGEYEFCRLRPIRPKPTWPTCDSCPDGTVCGEKNQQDLECRCRDINKDGKYEFCYLTKPKPPRPPFPTCDSCPDGTVCGEKNNKGQTCRCIDRNKDGNYDYCYLKPARPSWPTCDSCPDGTVCGENNSKGQTCRCMDINNDGKYEFCYLRPLIPIRDCSKECQEMGYKYGVCRPGAVTPETDWCESGETDIGVNGCPQPTVVGSAYHCCCGKEIKCTPEGGKNYFGKPPCCEDLTQISNSAPYEDGKCIAVSDGSGYCTRCGDGYCISPENWCNCPDDCCKDGETKNYVCPDGTEVPWCACENGNWVCIISPEIQCEEKCTPEGQSSMPPHNCCPGLDLVADCLPDEPCPISLRYCVDCGNGVCDAHENWYNCPEDCKTKKSSTSYRWSHCPYTTQS